MDSALGRLLGLRHWIGGAVRQSLRQRAGARAVVCRHLIFALCDHHEPLWGGATQRVGEGRLGAWRVRYPRLAQEFRDADGRPPQHTFFFPGEQARPGWLDLLAEFPRRGVGEVELHLHHEGDTSISLRRAIEEHVRAFAAHGHLARDADGRPRYGFIHGNWALANPRADGRHCGVDAELPLLFETGCYADFTFPSAPDESQPALPNRLAWPVGPLGARRAYESAEAARVGAVRSDRILLVQGPLAVVPRLGRMPISIENGALTAAFPPTPSRVRTWTRLGIGVEGRPDWIFVKVHTHGAPEAQAAALLGEPGRALHHELTTRYNDGRRWILHYVTAREMFNIAVAAMEGRSGDPNAYRDHVLPPPPARRG